MKKYIPSIITLTNLLFGFIAILDNDPIWSPFFILLGALLDLFDGMTAKLLHAVSELGKQLDSLADLVTFGVAPAYLYFSWILPHNFINVLIIGLIPVFSAVRLAKFNCISSPVKFFTGLPTPANGIFFASLPFLAHISYSNEFRIIIINPFIISLLPLLFSFLMIAPIRFFSFKNLSLKIQNNIFQYIFLITSAGLFIFFKFLSIPLIILLYIILSITENIIISGK